MGRVNYGSDLSSDPEPAEARAPVMISLADMLNILSG